MARPRKYASKVDDELERYVSAHRIELLNLLFDKDSNDRTSVVSAFTALAFALTGSVQSTKPTLSQLKTLVSRYVAYYQVFLSDCGYPCRAATLYGMVVSRLYELLVIAPQSGREGQSGVYFSGPHLAYFMAHLAKDRVGQCYGMIFDPCLGTGMLLMAYLDLLVDAGADALLVLLERFSGLELNPQILEIARLTLAISCLANEQLYGADCSQDIVHNIEAITARAQLSQGDALALPAALRSKASVLLVNPPWEGPASVYVQSLIETCNFACAVFVSPAALWTDKSARTLRQFVFDGNWLSAQYNFVNLDFALPVHSSQQYTVSVMTRGNHTGDIALCSDAGTMTQFDYAAKGAVTVNRSDFDGSVASLGGCDRLLLHIASVKDLQLLRELNRQGVAFGSLVATSRTSQSNDNRAFWLGREFDMTNDRPHFVPAHEFDSARHLPLIEGRMLEQFGYQSKSYVTGAGRSARWQCDGLGRPQFYLDGERITITGKDNCSYKIGFQSVGSAINKRTMIASVMPDLPCGNSVTVLRLMAPDCIAPFATLHLTAAVLNSFVFDYQVRARLHGNNINYFLLQNCILPEILPMVAGGIALDSEQALLFEAVAQLASEQAQGRLRHRRPMLEALIARSYGLSLSQYSLIVNGFDALSDNAETIKSRGFWRVDNELDAALRLPLMSWNQFVLLQKIGLSAYVDYVRSKHPGACDLTSV